MPQNQIFPPGPRGPGHLIIITHPLIAELTGLGLTTVHTYASRGQFDQKDLDSVLSFINHHRQKRGWELIGLPKYISGETIEIPMKSPKAAPKAPASGYNPLHAAYDHT